MEYFISQAVIILPVLGVNILRSTAAAPASPAVSSPVFELQLKREGISAAAREIDGEFTVLEGSGARMAWTGVEHAYKVLHEELVREEAIIPSPTAGRGGSPATRCSPARAPRRPSWWDGPRTGATTGRCKVRASVMATGKPRALIKPPETERCERADGYLDRYITAAGLPESADRRAAHHRLGTYTPSPAPVMNNRVVRGLVLVLIAVAWAVVVWVWPGLHLGNGTGSRGLQPAVLIAVGSIQAAVVLFGLAVGAIVLQVMAKYSWAVVRSVLPGWLVPVLVIVVGAGVVFPLWVAFSPTERLSTAAFAAFGWSLLVIGGAVWETAQRMNPPSLSRNIRRRALTVLSRDQRGGKASDDVAEVLGQLAADAELPYHEGLQMVGTYAMVLADRARNDSRGEIAVAVRALGERATSVESAALASSVVRALWVLGLDQADHPYVFDEAHEALTAIAGDARRRGQRELANEALDALASITAKRVGRTLPAVGYPTPPKPVIPPAPPKRPEGRYFPVSDRSLLPAAEHRPEAGDAGPVKGLTPGLFDSFCTGLRRRGCHARRGSGRNLGSRARAPS